MTEYIEREAVNALIKAECSPKVAAYLIDAVATIHAAAVRPVVKSKWVKMKFFPDWECEKCGSVISGNTPDPWNHYHYCPNCGADMRGES